MNEISEGRLVHYCEVCEHDRIITEIGGKPSRMLRLICKDSSYMDKKPCDACNKWYKGETDCVECSVGNKTHNQELCELCVAATKTTIPATTLKVS